MKEVLGRAHAMAGNTKFLVQFENEQKKERIFCQLVYLYSKEEICLDMDKPISNLPDKEQGDLLTIGGDSDYEDPCTFERGMYYITP